MDVTPDRNLAVELVRARSGTVRRVSGEHTFDKLERFTGRQYR
ncbi:MAG: hypothetical protein WD271_09520 [Acidimicrobiia bacterium]